MAITISTHNGSVYSLEHNIRNKYLIDSENKKWSEKHPGELRIDPNGEYIVLKHETLSDAYHKLFDESVDEWNDRQIKAGKSDRIINNYLSQIKAKEHTSKNAKHPAYEIIYAIGSKENPVPTEVSKSILIDMAKTFSERNPNLYVVSAVYHADEPNGVNHAHVTYIPVSYNCSRGMKVQTGLVEALRQQGIVGTAYSDTAQMQFEKIENNILESKCNAYRYKVIHPQRGSKQEHLTIEEYKLSKEIENKQKTLENLVELPAGKVIINKARLIQLEQNEKTYNKYRTEIEETKRLSAEAKESMRAYTRAYKKFEKDREQFDHLVNREAIKKSKVIIEQVLKFLKIHGLYIKFEQWVNEQKEGMRCRIK